MKIKTQKKKCLEIAGNIIHALFGCVLFYCIIKTIIGTQKLDYTGNIWSDIGIFFEQIGINELYTLIGTIGFVLFGIVGAYDYLYLNGLGVFVPPAYVKKKEEDYIKQAEKMMQLYYKQDIEFIREYENERTSYLLQAMGLEERQFHHINYEIVKARTLPENSIFALKKKAEKIILQREFVIDQSKIDCRRRVYYTVDYFLNLYTTLYDTEMRKSVAQIMGSFLTVSLKDRIHEIDYIVVPQESNLLLGIEVGEILSKPVIHILDKGRIDAQKPWDGEYREDKKNNIVVVHDVLVSGKRIYQSIEKLPQTSYNLLGIFNIAKYNDLECDPIKTLEEHEIPKNGIHWLLDIDKDILESVENGEYEWRYS